MSDVLDTEKDQDEQSFDPVAAFMRGAGRSSDDTDGDQGGGWGKIFANVAANMRGPRRYAWDEKEPGAPDTAKPRPTMEFRPGDSRSDDETMRGGETPRGEPLSGPAMGNAYAPPSDAARSLNQFAEASGTSSAPEPARPPAPPEREPVPGTLMAGVTNAPQPQLAKTNLERMSPPPTAPGLDPDYQKTQADLRAHSAVTPKYDPVTGKTLDQYKPSLGSRIGRAFLDAGEGFLYGGLGGAAARTVQGAFGNKDAPGYYGRGAVNSRYGQDEKARQQSVAADTAKIKSFEDQEKTQHENFRDLDEVWKDRYNVAKNQDIDDLKQQNADEKRKYDADTTQLKQQAEDLKEQLRSITYDPQKKQFMRGDQIYTPKNVEEGAVLEAQHGIEDGPYRKMWSQERRNQPININAGGNKGLSARDQLKLRTYMRTHGIKSQDDLTEQQLDEALSNRYTDPGDSNLRGDALKNFRADTDVMNIEGELRKLEQDRSTYTAGLGSDDPNLKKQSQDALKGIDTRVQELTGRRNQIRDRYVEQQNKRQQPTSQPAAKPAAQPAAKPVQTSRKEVDEYTNKAGQKVKKGDPVTYKGKTLYVTKIYDNGQAEYSDKPPSAGGGK